MRFNELLFETQIADIRAVDRFLDSFTEDHYVQQWLRSKAKKYIITRYHGPALQPLDSDSRQLPWMQRMQGDVFNFEAEADYDLVETIRNIADWLNHVVQTNRTMIPKIALINFDQANIEQKKWHQANAAKMNDDPIDHEPGAQTIMELDGGYRWVKLTDAECLGTEGDRMGHCVGDYAGQVSAGNINIYSLRDSKNRPHVTMEVKGKYVVQVQGKANTAPVLKYIPMIFTFARKIDARVSTASTDRMMKVIADAGLHMVRGKLLTHDEYRKIIEQELRLGDMSDTVQSISEMGANVYGTIDHYCRLLQDAFGMTPADAVKRTRQLLPRDQTRYPRQLRPEIKAAEDAGVLYFVMNSKDGDSYFWNGERVTETPRKLRDLKELLNWYMERAKERQLDAVPA